jgi:hypothetical protein
MKQIIHYMRRVTNADIITNTYPHLTKTSLVFSRTKQKPDLPTRKREIANMWHDPKKKNIPHVQSCPKQGLWDPRVACTRLPSKSCKDSLSYASTRAITSISFVVYIIIYSPHARACMSPKGKKKSRDEIVGLDRTVRSAFRCSASQYYCGNWEVTIGMRLWAKWLGIGLNKNCVHLWPHVRHSVCFAVLYICILKRIII